MPAPSDPASLQHHLDQIHLQLTSIGDPCPGSSSSRFLRRSKPFCGCTDCGSPGHGSYSSLAVKSGDKTVTSSVPPHARERGRQQITDSKRFRTLTGKVVGLSGKQPDGTAKTREAERRSFPTVARRIVIGDGTPWIWHLDTESFPCAFQIVDPNYAKRLLSSVAKALPELHLALVPA